MNLRIKNSSQPFVSIITPTMRDQHMDQVFNNFDRQYYKNKELIIVLNKNTMELDKWQQKAKKYPNVRVYQIDESASLGACKNFALEKAKYDYIAHFDDDDYYSPFYLINSMNCFKKVDTDIVGKATTYIYFARNGVLALYQPSLQNRFFRHVPDATLVYKKDITKKLKFNDITLAVETDFQKRCIAEGFKIYSGDKYDFVICRSAQKGHHTWQESDHSLLRQSMFITITKDFREQIINKRLRKYLS
ncbi:glycosyltransferase family A protein [Serpentinicella sp. ANB-PHB4]|uniref:glycosyltransferase family 2 protein n=1 Tax=Serpentinicella sp. ANB-PHB4 TaxID=3074076 RepID=UPI002866C4C5|nr:glycosyltransferase family A protein [Serpentinicella sp. ANB-PHB4]MDR5658452.1 glycosyltransferase family A protein [Serpentinicella sp. ANB-PHB4]